MLIRICLITAIVAGLATGGLSFLKVKEKVTTLQTNLRIETEGRQKAETELADTKTELDKTKQDLTKTKTDLATATDERDKAVTEAEAQRKRSATLTEQLTNTKRDLDVAQAELARWNVLGVTADQVRVVMARLKQAEADRTALTEKNKHLDVELGSAKLELARLLPGYRPPPLPAQLRGTVLIVDPKWDFVVLDVGEKQGVKEDGRLLVNRKGRLVAQLAVRSVSPERSVANVLPGSKLGEILEGDQVLPPEVQ